MSSIKQNKGFTLIELVIVIVIIGILAAVAIPKFAALTSQARTAENRGIGGGFSAAIMIAHTAWIAAGASGSASTVTLEGTAVNVNGTGWPDGGAGAGNITAAQCQSVVTQILNNPPTTSTTTCAAGVNTCYAITFTTGPNICTYTLNANGAAVTPATTIVYNASTGAITITP